MLIHVTIRGMNETIDTYNDHQSDDIREICKLLAHEIQASLGSSPEAENKIWHGSPVWFLNGNPIVGYAAREAKGQKYVQLLFWSGQSFEEPGLATEGSFKAAQVQYKNVNEVNVEDLRRWLEKSKTIQWDYKNIVKRKGQLDRLF